MISDMFSFTMLRGVPGDFLEAGVGMGARISAWFLQSSRWLIRMQLESLYFSLADEKVSPAGDVSSHST